MSPFPPGTLSATERSISKKASTLLLVLALLLISGGFGLMYYAAIARPGQLRAGATATAQVLLNLTATVNTQATSVAQTYARATVTAATQATTQAQATETALQNLYATSTKGTPAFFSPLSSQDAGNWDVYNTVGGSGCAFVGGALHSSINQKSFYVPCFAHATHFTNFVLDAEMTIVKGDQGGLIFRANDAISHFYSFRVSSDGMYSLYLSKDDHHSTPLLYDTSSLIKTGSGTTNRLTVIAKGSNMYLYINKQYVSSLNDATCISGEIGVFAGDNNNATDVAFNNVRVWTI